MGEGYQFIEVLSQEQWDTVHNVITVYGTASIGSGSIQKVEYSIDDASWQLATGQEDWSFKWDTTTVDNGGIRIKIRSFDGEEYSKEYILDLIVSNIGTSIIAPMNGTTVKGKAIIKGTSFGADVRAVLIKIGDDEWIDVQATSGKGNFSTWQFEWNTNDYQDGEYIIYTKAYNFDWYSVTDNVDLIVNNQTRTTSGFLPAFDLYPVLLALLLMLVINYRKRVVI